MLIRLLKVVLPQVLQQWLGVLGKVCIDLAQPCCCTHPSQVAVEALAETGQHESSQVLILHWHCIDFHHETVQMSGNLFPASFNLPSNLTGL